MTTEGAFVATTVMAFTFFVFGNLYLLKSHHSIHKRRLDLVFFSLLSASVVSIISFCAYLLPSVETQGFFIFMFFTLASLRILLVFLRILCLLTDDYICRVQMHLNRTHSLPDAEYISSLEKLILKALFVTKVDITAGTSTIEYYNVFASDAIIYGVMYSTGCGTVALLLQLLDKISFRELIIFGQIFFLFFAPYYFFKIRKVRKKFSMHLEMMHFFVVDVVTVFLIFALYLLSLLNIIEPKYVYLAQGASSSFFILFSYVFPVFPIMAGKKSKIPVSPIHLQQVYSDKSLWEELKDQLAQDYCIENALFIEQFDKLSGVSCAEVCRALGKISTPYDLFDIFIGDGAPNELNLTYHVRNVITQHYNDKNLTLDMLLPVRQVAWDSIVHYLLTLVYKLI